MAVGAIIGMTSLVMGLYQQTTNIYKPLGRAGDYANNYFNPNLLLDPQSLISLVNKDVLTLEKYRELMRMHGFNKWSADNLLEVVKPLLSAYEYISLWRRGKISLSDMHTKLQRLGMKSEEMVDLVNSTEFLPSAGDMIRFAVRDVYNPGKVESYGLMEDIPLDYLRESKKAGLNEQNAREYWAAHWQLPSPNMAFEMYQRRIINENQLNELLKSLDIMPFWRSRLTKLAYNPLTRVDVRRMYGFGVLNENDVYESYLDVGYSPENAKRLTDFTVLYEDDELTGVTRSGVVNSFMDDLITQDELISFLTEMGYSEKVITFWVNQALYDKTVRKAKDYANELKTLYFEGGVDLNTIRVSLVEQGLPDSFVNRVLNETIRENSLKIKTPDINVLTRWLERDVISESEFKVKSSRLGYTNQDIMNWLTEYRLTNDLKKRKFLDIKIYGEWYVEEILTEDSFYQIMIDIGYSKTDRDNLLTKWRILYVKRQETIAGANNTATGE